MDQLSAHLDRGWDLAQKGDAPGASACAKRALELDPQSPEVHDRGVRKPLEPDRASIRQQVLRGRPDGNTERIRPADPAIRVEVASRTNRRRGAFGAWNPPNWAA